MAALREHPPARMALGEFFAGTLRTNKVEIWAQHLALHDNPHRLGDPGNLQHASRSGVAASRRRRLLAGDPERVPAEADLTLASVAFTIAPRDIYRTTALAGTRTL